MTIMYITNKRYKAHRMKFEQKLENVATNQKNHPFSASKELTENWVQ